MNLRTTIKIAKEYRALGSAVQDQLDKVLADPSEDTFCDCNINALAQIHEFFTEIAWLRDEDASCDASGIAEEIQAYVEAEPTQTIRFGRVVRR